MPSPSPLFTRNAYAKLNLRLHVGSKNGGILHTILSAIAQIDLADCLEFFDAADGFSVTCDDASIAANENLVWRAAQALALALPPLRIHVRKHIPTQAGLGGGSTDAAAGLLGVAHLLRDCGREIAPETIEAAARQTGSDVPACLVPGLKIVAGRGERVLPRPGALPPWGILLLKPEVGMSSAGAYQLLDAAPDTMRASLLDENSVEFARCEEIIAAAHAGDFKRFCGLLHNDFAAVVASARDAIARARTLLQHCGARASVLCGSGSCVAGFFEAIGAARAARDALQAGPHEWSAVTRFSDDA